MNRKLIQALERQEKIIGEANEIIANLGPAISLIKKIVTRIKIRRAKRKAENLRKQIEAQNALRSVPAPIEDIE